MSEKYIESVIERHGLLSWLGVDVDTVEEEKVVLSVPHDEKFVNSTDNIQGGVLATVIDFTSAMLFKTQFEDPDNVSTVTTNMNISYLQPALSDQIATAEPVWIGSSTGVATVLLRSKDNGDRTAFGTTTFRFFER